MAEGTSPQTVVKFPPIAIAVSAAAGCLVSETEAEDVTVGFDTVACAAGSDTIVCVPFRRSSAHSGAVSGAPAIGAETATITAADSPAFSAGQFTAEAHYLFFTGDGSRAGWSFPVTAHDGTTITIDLENDDLSGVSDGDPFEIVPYWTLATLFPKQTQNTIHVSPNKLAVNRMTRVLFFNNTGNGIDLAPDRIHFLTPEGWFRTTRGFPNADDAIIPPGSAFVIRHPSGATATSFTPSQVVVEGTATLPLRTRTAGPQDNPVGMMRPLPVKLSELDLDGAAFEESASTDPGDRMDQLFVYDNLVAAVNRQPSTIYFKVGGSWHRDDGATYPAADDDELVSSWGLLIRKAASASGATERWMNLPRY